MAGTVASDLCAANADAWKQAVRAVVEGRSGWKAPVEQKEGEEAEPPRFGNAHLSAASFSKVAKLSVRLAPHRPWSLEQSFPLAQKNKANKQNQKRSFKNRNISL